MVQPDRLATLPPEIILRILDYLYINQQIRVERELPEQQGEAVTFRMKRMSLSAQLVRTCKHMYQETNVLLYANNVFNCSQRECLKLLLQSIGSKNFSSIKHIIIDWEQLQDFAWSLAKEEYNTAMSGLETVELATWRMRVLGGTSFLWKEVKSYERQLCQAAVDICAKHPKLNVVAQLPFHRSNRGASASHRIKWRFITSATELRINEVEIPIEDELAQIKASGDSEAGGTGASQMIDPF